MITNRIKELVSVKPETQKQPNVKRLLDNVGMQLAALGFKVRHMEYNGAYSLYAHPEGSKHSKVLLEGHVDVVPAINQPFKIEGDKVLGRGVYDMLFGVACYLELFNDLKDKVDNLDVGIMLTGDEELGGFDGVKEILAEGYSTDVCIIPDAGEGFGVLSIAAKGVYTLIIKVHGVAHHGARPWEGDSATTKIIKLLSEVEDVFDKSSEHHSTLTIARIHAGDSENKGPGFADCTLDIRYKDKADLERIKKELEPLFNKYNVETIEAKNGDDYQLDLGNEHVKSFLKLYEKAVGKEIELTKAHGSSDARFFAARGIPVIMLRPDGGDAHGDNEWVSKSSIDIFYKLLKDYVLETAIK